MLREHPAAATRLEALQGVAPAMFADQLMDRLVAAKPPSADALVARYGYRDRYKLPQSDQDLQSALTLDPNHLDSLLLSARAAYSQPNQAEQVERWLRRAIEAAPGDPRGYAGLAQLLEQKGDRQAALE